MDNTYLSKTTSLSATSSSYFPKTTLLSATSSSYFPETTSLSDESALLPETLIPKTLFQETVLPKTNFSLAKLNKQSMEKNTKYTKVRHLKVFQTYWCAGETWEIKIKIKNFKMKIVLDDQAIELIINSENQVSLNNLTDPNIINWITYPGDSIDNQTNFTQGKLVSNSKKLMYPDEIDELLIKDSIFSMFINPDGLILVIVMYNF